jgi:hypothetical protein
VPSSDDILALIRAASPPRTAHVARSESGYALLVIESQVSGRRRVADRAFWTTGSNDPEAQSIQEATAREVPLSRASATSSGSGRRRVIQSKRRRAMRRAVESVGRIASSGALATFGCVLPIQTRWHMIAPAEEESAGHG